MKSKFFKFAILSLVFFMASFSASANVEFSWANNRPGCTYTVKVYDGGGTVVYNSNVPGITCITSFSRLEIIDNCNSVWTYDCTGLIGSPASPCCPINTFMTLVTCGPFAGLSCGPGSTLLTLDIH